MYGGDWNGSGLQCIMTTMILMVTSMAKATENTEKTRLQIVHQKIQSSGSDTMLEILNECIVFDT